MAWELSKENLQPLKRGRDPVKLEGVSPSPACFKDSIEKQRRQFWAEIARYSGPDPLELWLRFIKWTQQSFSSGGHQAELVPLLERCTRELQSVERYRNDIRYLRVWIQYADCLPEPRDVFDFLMENDIGQDFALYYIAFAAYLELRGNFTKAEAVFALGLKRMAVPVDKLRAKYEDFKERMERRKQRKAQEGGQLSTAADDEIGLVRQSLGVLRSTRRGAASRSHHSTIEHGATGVQEPKRRALAPTIDKENTAGAGLEVFVDDEFRAGNAPSMPDFGLASKRTGGAWNKLSTFQSNRKENEQEAAMWAGSKMKQKKALMPAPAPTLDIPVDDNLKDQSPVIQKPPEGTLRQRLETAGTHHLEEDLQHDPLRLFKDPDLAASAQQQHAAHPFQKHGAPVKAQLKKGEAAGYNMAMAMGPDGKEISFEEVRARVWLSQQGPSIQPASPSQSSDMDTASSPPTALPSKQARFAASPPVQIAASTGHSASASDVKAEEGAIQVERTAAFNTLNAGCTGPLHRHLGSATMRRGSQGAQPSKWVPQGASRGELNLGGELTRGLDVTTNTQEAYAAMNSMFRGALPHDCAWNTLQASPGANTRRLNALPEPTVTISTRAAFAAVNEMFGGCLPHEAQRQQLRGEEAGSGIGRLPIIGMSEHTGSMTPAVKGRGSRGLDDQTEGLVIYEDTELLNSPAHSRPWTPTGQNGGTMPSPTEGFEVYEDTDFRLGQAPSPAEMPGKRSWVRATSAAFDSENVA